MPEWGWVVLFALAFLGFILGSRRRRAPVTPIEDPDVDKLNQTVVAYRSSRDRPELVTLGLPQAVVFASADGHTTFRAPRARGGGERQR